MTDTLSRSRFPLVLALLVAALAAADCAGSGPGAAWPGTVVPAEQLRPLDRVQVKLLKRELRGYLPSGTVVLRLHIDETGGVRRAVIADTSGDAALDAAAAQAITGARFAPYREQGVAVAVSTLMPMSFRPAGQCFAIASLNC